MARTLPFMLHGHCIDCGQSHQRTTASWRCWSCNKAVLRLRQRCVIAVQGAIKSGMLQPVKSLPCVDCGNPAKAYDHRDYSQPLSVDAVCHSCNFMRGPARWPGDAGALSELTKEAA